MWVLNQALLDEMGSRIDDLEKSIGELVKEAGVDSPPSPPTSSQGQLPPKWVWNIVYKWFQKLCRDLALWEAAGWSC